MKIAITVLSVLLAAVLAVGVILYLKYGDLKHAQETNNKEISELNQQIDQSNKELAELREKVTESAQCFEKLDSASKRISQMEEKTKTLESQLEEKKRAEEQLKADITGLKDAVRNKDAAITQLQEELKVAESRIPSLTGEIAKSEGELKELQARVTELRAQKLRFEKTVEQMKSAYNGMVSDLKDQIEKKEVSISQLEQKLTISFLDRVLFEFGKATLTRQGKQTLDKVGKGLRSIEGREIRVIGHADDIPIHPGYRYKFPSNWELSAARAATVVRYFQVEMGLDPKSMEAVGHSFYYPITSNETPEGRAQNRRVEITVAPKLD